LPIEPRLYQKYTGKLPGAAMSAMGESLAQSAAQKSRESMRGPQSMLVTWYKWRLIVSVVGAIGVGIVALFSLL